MIEYQVINCLNFQLNHMFWVLKRIISSIMLLFKSDESEIEYNFTL